MTVVKRWTVIFVLGIAVILIWLLPTGVLGLTIPGLSFAKDLDPYSAVAALFSGFAFLGIIGSLALQKEELRLQRAELQLQRKEMEFTREEIAGQREEMARQNSHNLFIQLLTAWSSSVEEIDMPFEQPRVSGRKAIERAAKAITESTNWVRDENYRNKRSADAERDAQTALEMWQRRCGQPLGYYFLFLQALYGFMETHRESSKEYRKIIQSLLSQEEREVIRFYVKSIRPQSELARLENEFHLLSLLPT